jgi:hypothetical protein
VRELGRALALKRNQRIKKKNGKNKAGAGQKMGEQDKPETSKSDPKTAALNRHKGQCTICSHEKCKEIEAAFVAWKSPEKIAAEFALGHRSTVYRHAEVLRPSSGQVTFFIEHCGILYFFTGGFREYPPREQMKSAIFTRR